MRSARADQADSYRGVAVYVYKILCGAKLMKEKIFVWLLATLVLTTAPHLHAQQSGKIFPVGFLDSSTASGMAVLVDAFRQELRKLGWIDGKNISFEYVFVIGVRQERE